MKIENRNKIIGTIAFFVIAFVTFSCSGTNPKPIEQTSPNQVKVQNTTAPEPKENTFAGNKIPPKNMPPGEIPADLVNTGEFGENIYDDVKAKNWTKAAAKLDELQKTNAKLVNEKNSSLELDTTIAALEKAVAAKDESTALREANQVTFIVADLTAKYNPVVPIEVVKLDFYGRELEIWSMAKDEAKLKTTTQAIRETWNAVKSKVEARSGTKQAKAFEASVINLEAAKTPADYAKLAKPILDQVDDLEKVFEGKLALVYRG